MKKLFIALLIMISVNGFGQDRYIYDKDFCSECITCVETIDSVVQFVNYKVKAGDKFIVWNTAPRCNNSFPEAEGEVIRYKHRLYILFDFNHTGKRTTKPLDKAIAFWREEKSQWRYLYTYNVFFGK